MQAKVLVPVGIVVAALVALVLLHPMTKRYRIPSESMRPTFDIGDIVSVDQGAYDDDGPAVGDIVVFPPPTGAVTGDEECGARHPADAACPQPTAGPAGELFIKRVVAGPGDVVAVRTSHVYRNGKREDDPYIRPCASPEGCDFPRKITVPAGMYFIVGDNRGESDDSRHFGPVKREWIVGRAVRCHALYFACSPAE